MPGPRPLQKAVAALFAVVALCAAGRAQAPEPPGLRPMKAFREAEGLPQTTINALAQDREGRLWAGTIAGIARFDGRSWRRMEGPASGYALMVNTGAMTATSDGSLWAGTRFQGLLEYRREGLKVHNSAQGTPLENINAVLESSRKDASGRPILFAATYGRGLARYADGAWSYVPSELPDGRLHCLLERDGILWVGTHRGLWTWDGEHWKAFEGNATLADPVVRALAETVDPQGRRTLWIGMERGGLFLLRHGRLEQAPLRERTGSTSVRGLLAGPGGVLYAALGGGGLAVVDGDRWNVINTRNGLPTDYVRCVALASGGPTGTALWAGTEGKGALRLHPGGWHRFTVPWTKVDQRIQCFAETPDPSTGRTVLWMGHGGLARLKDGVWTLYHPDPDDKADSVRALFAFPGDDVLHFGKGGDLVVFNGYRFRSYTERDGLPPGQIRALAGARDATGRRILWIGTSRGLATWDGAAFKTVPAPPGESEPSVRSIALDGERTWVGTDRGLHCLKAGSWIRPPGLAGLPAVGVQAILPIAPRGGRGLLLGTFGSGVLCIPDVDRADGFRAFTTRNTPALRSDLVYDIVPDGQGRFLVSASQGVARLDPAGWTWDAFSQEDGLPANECLKGGLYRDSAGRVWVGTEEGPAWADLRTTPPDRTPKPLVLAAAVAGGRPMEPGAQLPHSIRDVAFEFRLLSGHREQDTLFRCSLEGLRAAPGDWSPDAAAHFPSLPPGDYTLAVWARDYAGNESGPIRFPFTVNQPWWNRSWAWILYLLAAGGAVQALLRLRTRILADRNRDLEARVAGATEEIRRRREEAERMNQELLQLNLEKNKFLGIAAHDLRSPLNTITLVSEGIASGDLETCPPELKPWIRKISTSARHMTELIEAFLDVTALESGRLLPAPTSFPVAAVLEPLASLLQPRLDGKDQRLEVEAPAGLLVLADASHLRQILDNLLSNASKFSPREALIRLSVHQEGAAVRFTVADQGPGLTPDDQARLFRRFAKLSARPTAGEASSGLGLSIVKHLVDANGGRIWAGNLPEGGCAFHVELPGGGS